MNILLIKEIRRILRLNEAEASMRVSKEKKTDFEVPTIASPIIDYLGTDERKELTFPMKYAFLVQDSEAFVKDMQYLYLKFKKEGKTVSQILDIIAPHLTGSVSTFKQFLNAIETEYEKALPGERDKVFYYPSEEVKKYGKETARHFFDETRKDAKAVIAYNFSASDNQLKLRPRGFWMLQFATRILIDVEKYPEEEVFFVSSHASVYKNKALNLLQSFYMKAIVPLAMNLTGRYVGVHPDDVDFKIKVEAAFDKVKDGLMSGKYDANRDNFGAWAFTVAKNAIIDIIKTETRFEFATGISGYDAFESLGNVWHFNEIMDIDQELLSSGPEEIEVAGKILYKYTFKSPFEAYQYFSEHADVQDLYRTKLSSFDRKRLVNQGVLKSTRIDVDYQPGVQEPPEELYKNKLTPKVQNRLLRDLSNFFKTRVGLSYAGNEYKKQAETDGFSEDEIEEAFDRDLGKAIYYFWKNYVYNAPYWMFTPSEEILNTVDKKYNIKLRRSAFKLDAPVEESFFDPKSLNVKTGEKDVYSELKPYVGYKISAKQNAAERDRVINNFIRSQRRLQQKNPGVLIFTFANKSVFKEIGSAIAKLNVQYSSNQPLSSKGPVKINYTTKFLNQLKNNLEVRGVPPAEIDQKVQNYVQTKRPEELKNISDIISNLSGAEVMFEEQKISDLKKLIREEIKGIF